MTLNAKIDMADGQEFALTGLLAVDEKKLLQLSDEQALELFKSGELAWVYCHLMSLGNISSLVNRMAKNSKPVVDRAIPAATGKKAAELPAVKKATVKKAATRKTADKKETAKKSGARKPVKQQVRKKRG